MENITRAEEPMEFLCVVLNEKDNKKQKGQKNGDQTIITNNSTYEILDSEILEASINNSLKDFKTETRNGKVVRVSATGNVYPVSERIVKEKEKQSKKSNTNKELGD